jgi:MOSC domain-containing protein YiiM
MLDEQRARIVSVNVGAVRTVLFHGQVRTTGIWKEPVAGRVAVGPIGLAGDQQADRVNHGGTGKAVYAYASEDARWWQSQLGQAIPPGTFGENLTTIGMPINDASVGELWAVGTAILQVVQPRFPCWKLGLRMDDSHFPKHFLAAGRVGAYLSVVEEGEVGAGDAIEVISRPTRSLTVGLIAHLNHTDRPLALRLLDAAETGGSTEELDALLARAGGLT